MSTTETRSQPTYHDTDAQYALPNDSTEHTRLNVQASGISQLLGGSPVLTSLTSSSAKTFADIGCGTGAVTSHLASTHPSATVYGVDLSPVPASAPQLPNLTYVRGNIHDLATGPSADPRFAAESLDFVFSRLLICGITDWPGYTRDVAQTLKPGGRIELQDVSYKLYKHGKRVDQERGWFKALEKYSTEKGLDMFCGEKLGQWMREAGLGDVEVREFRYPFGTWLKGEVPETEAIGRHNAEMLPGVMWHLLERVVGGKEEKSVLKGWQEDCLRDLGDNEGLEWRWFVAMGRKGE